MAGVWPTELNLFFLPCSGLKSPEEEFGQVDWGSPNEEWTAQQGMPRTCSQTFLLCRQSPVQPFVLCGPSFKTLSRTCLLGVIQCDLEKKSVGHNLKTGQKKNCKGQTSCLPIPVQDVCVSQRLSPGVVVFYHSWMPGCVSFS